MDRKRCPCQLWTCWISSQWYSQASIIDHLDNGSNSSLGQLWLGSGSQRPVTQEQCTVVALDPTNRKYSAFLYYSIYNGFSHSWAASRIVNGRTRTWIHRVSGHPSACIGDTCTYLQPRWTKLLPRGLWGASWNCLVCPRSRVTSSPKFLFAWPTDGSSLSSTAAGGR